MGCTDCHPAEELHADGTGIPNRRHLPQRPGCLTCHEGILSASSRIKAHASHGKKLACQICHAQAYKNCFACHVGTDKKGLPYFKCKKTASGFKIGLNPDKGLPWEFTLVRHVPVAKETFAFYDARGLVQFDGVPTWKPAAPHNILRKTDQNQDCNHCHGNPDLFLTGTDLEKSRGQGQ